MKKYRPRTDHYRDLLTACRAELVTLGYGPAALALSGVGELLRWLEQRGRHGIDGVDRADMEAYLSYLQTRPNLRGGSLSPHTIDQYRYGAKLLFDYCERHGLRGGSPLAGLARTQVQAGGQQQRYVATRAEIDQLYAVAARDDGRLTVLLHLLYGCGLRRTEVERLNVGDVDYPTELLYVRRGKGRKRRIIPLTPRVAAGLRDYQRRQRWRWVRQQQQQQQQQGGECRAFLLNDRGGRMRGPVLAVRLKKLVVRAGVSEVITPHVLRHSVATHLLRGGMALERIRDFLGHDYLQTTQLYTHVKQDDR